jgi:hypothetical protein
MSRQYFDDLPNEPLMVANTIVSFLTAELALLPAVQVAIPPGDIRPGKVWRLTAGGIWTPSAATTMIITPRWGTTTAGPTLGASITQTISVGAAGASWYLQGTLMCRAMGVPGSANNTFHCQGIFNGAGLTTISSNNTIAFGGTQTTAGDITTAGAQGFFIGCTFSVTGATMTPQIVCLQSLN